MEAKEITLREVIIAGFAKLNMKDHINAINKMAYDPAYPHLHKLYNPLGVFEVARSPAIALATAFPWVGTDQGEDYWSDAFEKLYEAEAQNGG